jgi:aminopeptidase
MAMVDLRVRELATKLVNYSVELKKGEKIFIEMHGKERDLLKEIIKEVYKIGASPYVSLKDAEVTRELLLECSVEQLKDMAKFELERMKEMDAYIGIRAGDNANELSDVPSEKLKIYSEEFGKIVHLNERVTNTKWCVLRYPNPSMAQLANMSTEKFEDFYFDVCNLDYSKMSKAMDSLVELMQKTDKVKITGKNTDLEFSIKDIPVVKCDGKCNIPDGEVYTAPVKNSVNGVISYNVPSKYQGFTYENIKLEFKDGKIIKATANDTERINKVFDSDDGARYVGEFAIGVNPYIVEPMKDTLFDEKIKGSIHFTPGNAYVNEADNGNRSSIHWDLVFIQRSEYGGGELIFDGKVIRKDGIFVLPELEALNPENLK